MAEMEQAMRAAKARSESARAQCAALRTQGKQQDALLERMSPPEKRANVPMLNLGAILNGDKATGGTGRLGALMSKAKEKARSPKQKSSPKRAGSSRGRDKLATVLSPVALPTIESSTESSDGESSSPEEVLSREALLSGALTARSLKKVNEPVGLLGHRMGVPALNMGGLGCVTPTGASNVSLRPATARVGPLDFGYRANNARGGLGRNAMNCKVEEKIEADSVDDLLAELSF